LPEGVVRANASPSSADSSHAPLLQQQP